MTALDVLRAPLGGFGVVIHQTNFNFREMRAALANHTKLVGLKMNSSTRKLDIEQPVSVDMLEKIFSDPRVCFKLLFSCDHSLCIKEDLVIERLHGRLTEQEFDRLTTYKPIDGMYMFRVDSLDNMITITTRLGSNTLQRLYLIPQSFCEIPSRNNPTYIRDLKSMVFALNYKGIFHNDIKKDNIMICDGRASFIDFGSTFVDNDPDDDIKRYYKPKSVVYPVIHQFYGFPPRGDTTLSRTLMMIFSKTTTLKSMLNRYKNDKLFQRYLAHKNDAFAVAAYLVGQFDLSGGGLFACFKPRVNAGSLTDHVVRGQISDVYPNLASMLYFDEQDYEDFRGKYMQAGCRLAGGSAKKKYRAYNGKRYLVRTGKRGGRYILVQGKKIYHFHGRDRALWLSHSESTQV